MAKKNKRPVNSAPSFAATSAARTEFAPDYTTVKKDLARIGVLAGSLFGLLIVLAFILN
ncbi:MAG: hypothetical protein IT311_04195 [Anaerolineales bacterium]|nr:hypothetical protein [Anaerolineales bacterium]